MKRFPINWEFRPVPQNRTFRKQEDNYKKYYSVTINQNKLKMQFENFDNKIWQAAEQHHPSYDEKAWSRMAKLLDKNLPQKDDRRRRIIFIFLLFLLVGAGILTWV